MLLKQTSEGKMIWLKIKTWFRNTFNIRKPFTKEYINELNKAYDEICEEESKSC